MNSEVLCAIFVSFILRLLLWETRFTEAERNFRIWGEQGQAALEKASICLLNCGPTGSETLKNLVLGGVGSITVIDGSKVDVGDLGNNFMGMYECVLCVILYLPAAFLS